MDRRIEPGHAERLRVLIANESAEYLSAVAAILAGLGHEVTAHKVDAGSAVPVIRHERPDVALVVFGGRSEHTLGLIEEIVGLVSCPVILLLHHRDPEFVRQASKRGIFGCITDDGLDDWKGAIDIVFRRFAEYQDLRGAFVRRSTIERAKGILMERHAVDEHSAFAMLRDYSRTSNRKLVEIAAAVVDGHRLLVKQPFAPAQQREPAPTHHLEAASEDLEPSPEPQDLEPVSFESPLGDHAAG